MNTAPRNRHRRRRRSTLDPSLAAVRRIEDYYEELEDREDWQPRDGQSEVARPAPPTKPQLKFEELTAVAQECIGALDPSPYYVLDKTLAFAADSETAELFAPLRKKIAALRMAAVEVDREAVDLRAAMIEREINR